MQTETNLNAILERVGRARATRKDGNGPVTATMGFTRKGKEGPALGDTVTHKRDPHADPDTYVWSRWKPPITTRAENAKTSTAAAAAQAGR